jgi:HEPN domain-containing protein
MKKEIKDWIDIADEDVQMAQTLLQEGTFTRGPSFYCQQAIEKYFKAYLLENGWALKKTHNLKELYDEIKKIKGIELDEKILSEINETYFETRYPDSFFVPTQDQAKTFLDFTKQVQKTIKQELISPANIHKT